MRDKSNLYKKSLILKVLRIFNELKAIAALLIKVREPVFLSQYRHIRLKIRFENNLYRLFSAFFFFLDDFLQLQKRNLFILYPVLQHVFRFYISKLKVLLPFFALFIIGKPAQLFHPIIHNFFSRHSE